MTGSFLLPLEQGAGAYGLGKGTKALSDESLPLLEPAGATVRQDT